MAPDPPSKPPVDAEPRSWLRRLVHPEPSGADIFSRESTFAPSLGSQLGPEGQPRGYHIDFSMKATVPSWPPDWIARQNPNDQIHVESVQWALGAWERYQAGEGEEWREAALACAQRLLASQEVNGANDGAWLHWAPMPHSYRIDPPWISAITQGEAASLFVRLHLETGEGRFAEAAIRALRPMTTPVARGGVLVEVGGLPFFEEYPTRPASLVLNGAIFALWGFRDVAAALGDDDARGWYEGAVECLASMMKRYDTGYWSLYDLYPHPLAHVASSSYHFLHIQLLRALELISPRSEFGEVRERFEAYRESPAKQRRALAATIGFRLVTPRNELLAHRLPWNQLPRRRQAQDLVVLGYHGVSEDWHATLAVTPASLSEQVSYLLDRGYRPATFTEAVLGPRTERTFSVTFDDAYASVGELALPILEQLGVPGTVFVPTAYTGQSEAMEWPGIDRWIGTPHEGELIPMDWKQLGELAERGWEIGSHTKTHPRLPELTDDQLLEELQGSREEIERRLGQRCLSLAYPYGDYDQRVIRAAADAGYAAAATLAVTPEAPLAWPRIGVYDIDDLRRFKLKVSRSVRAFRRARN
jgi:peptidoglycan/xylan/chitin deacetylase (PgdA/CDA1 family)